MIVLYRHPSGASECRVLEAALPPDEWAKLQSAAAAILRARGKGRAADLLQQMPFRLSDGTNFFGDEFAVLDAVVSLDQYVAYSALENDSLARRGLSDAAEVLTEIDRFVRFVIVRLDTTLVPGVATPEPRLTAAVVERALRDAQHLLDKSGAISAIDRAHTALHGYMLRLSEDKGIDVPADASVTQLLKVLRAKHPAMAIATHDGETTRILNSLAAIADALNTLRNRASLAHPNQLLLSNAEAVLALNTIKTLLHYLDMKTSSTA